MCIHGGCHYIHAMAHRKDLLLDPGSTQIWPKKAECTVFIGSSDMLYYTIDHIILYFNMFYSILFYSILFYSILFYSIL